jgi:AraC-like DNA-binding protein
MVASSIGLSPRTLQRLLGRQGLSFSMLVDDVRLATARHLLDETECRLSEIALRLGYSDAAHFTRAFRRWTGVTPSEHRRNHKAQ